MNILLHISNKSSHSSSVDKAVRYESERANMNNSCVYSIIESIRFTLLFRINTKLRNNHFQTIELSIQKAAPLNKMLIKFSGYGLPMCQKKNGTAPRCLIQWWKCIQSKANIKIAIIYAGPPILMICRH